MADILLNDDNDLLVLNGDFAVGDTEEQEFKRILEAVKNDYKQTPEIGVNLVSYLNGVFSKTLLEQQIKINLRADGKKTKSIKIENGTISIR